LPVGAAHRQLTEPCLCGNQVRKDDKELERGFGTGPVLQGVPRGVQKTQDGEVKMVTVMLFGDAEQCQKVRCCPGPYCRNFS